MSEPMSTVEIEDVLSSIRRLVSDDLRPAARPAPVAAEAAEKLILTPALRVVPAAVADGAADVVPAADLGEAPAADAEVAFRHHALADNAPVVPVPENTAQSIEAVVSVVGAAVSVGAWEGEGDDSAMPAGNWAHEAWPAVAGVGAVQTEVEDAEVVQASTEPVTVAVQDWGAPQDWGQAEDWSDATATEPAPQDLPPAAKFAAEAASTLPPDAGARLRDDQAEAEAVAEIQAHDVPDMAAETAPHEAEPYVGMFDADETLLDEEVLRDLVRDIIREELQGALGERITRNVRKLVRAEINRAFASREFD